ncbi:DUF1827 family protein [Enterococcus timonensis]|uniref:DUF1827 family protein n=1 Tax=Enterococcus timonensis TaxID=1852364 RepID=UPI0008DB02A8|nr:DUF1827 family protein [Enterococcus timonensis]
MKMIDVTNSHGRLVQKQLENTDANFVRVYSLGQTTVVYTEAATHIEILLINKVRNVQSTEVEFVLDYYKRNQHLVFDRKDIEVIHLKGVVELSIKRLPAA